MGFLQDFFSRIPASKSNFTPGPSSAIARTLAVPVPRLEKGGGRRWWSSEKRSEL